MKPRRFKEAWIALAGMLMLSGCAQLPTSISGQSSGTASENIASFPAMPSQSAGIRSLLDYAGEVAVLPPQGQQVACGQAKTQLNRHSTDHARMTLALIAALVPACLPSDQLQSLVQPLVNNPDSPFRGLARIVSNVAFQRKTSAQALVLARQETAELNKKLKALTRIETQLNQVKDRELQNIH